MSDRPEPAAEDTALRWSDDGLPISQEFDDVYFSRHDGLSESRHVFLRSNGLPERWQNPAQSQFVIAETGFGTGLNFLATWQSWLEHAPRGACLHFISVEKYPLEPSDLRRALALWPELEPLATRLINAYPPVAAHGFHRLDFGGVKLTLIFDDAQAGLAQLLPLASGNRTSRQARWSPHFPDEGLVDAWYLDGFAPAKNPQMWTADLFDTMARLSHQNTTLATFTVAGAVRRGLQHAGFEWRKVAGYGRKREMLCGRFTGLPETTAAKPGLRWHLTDLKAPSAPHNVAIIGAGLAGATTANALARMNIPVTVFERNTVASGASGNPQGIVYSRLSHQNGVLPRFNLTSYTYALRFYHQTDLFTNAGNPCGVLQLLHDKNHQRAQEIIQHYTRSAEFVKLLSAEEASSMAGVPVQQPALYFPRSGWLSPAEVCRRQLDHQHITLREHRAIGALERRIDGWHLHSQERQFGPFSAVIICSAQEARQFPQCQAIPTRGIRGQVSNASANNQSRQLRCVVCAEGYISPQTNGQHCLGATFDLTCQTPDLQWQDHQDNLNAAAAISDHFKDLAIARLEDGRAAIRCTTPDYLPIVGPAIDYEATKHRFAPLSANANHPIDAAGVFQPHLYVNLGHGSRGLTYTPLCAQVIANLLTGTPMPLPRDLMQHLHPGRFIIRDLIKNRQTQSFLS